MDIEQYKLVWARRVVLDTRMWQTPSIAVAAQALLVGPAMRTDTPPAASIVLSAFAILVGFGALQLFARLRHLETCDALLLERYERENDKFSVIHAKDCSTVHPPSALSGMKSYRLWLGILAGFVLLDGYALLMVLAF